MENKRRMYILALDPAQLHDWSALAALQVDQDLNFTNPPHYRLVNLERRQSLPYDKIVAWAIKAFQVSAFQKNGNLITEEPAFVLDSTGVGVALTDMIRAVGVRPKACTITAGNSFTAERSYYHVGKARLIGKFLAAFDSGRVLLNPNLPIFPLLQQELLNYRAEISSQGAAKFEAAPGAHDDMVFALALAVWWGEEKYNRFRSVEVEEMIWSG